MITIKCRKDSLALKAGRFLKKELRNNKRRCVDGISFRETFLGDFDIDEKTLRRWTTTGIQRIAVIEEIANYFEATLQDILDQDQDVPFFYKKQFEYLLPFNNQINNSEGH